MSGAPAPAPAPRSTHTESRRYWHALPHPSSGRVLPSSPSLSDLPGATQPSHPSPAFRSPHAAPRPSPAPSALHPPEPRPARPHPAPGSQPSQRPEAPPAFSLKFPLDTVNPLFVHLQSDL